jgi:hypothetical protein
MLAAAILLAGTAFTASAAQPDVLRFPPFSNSCLKAGGTVGQPEFSQSGELVSISCVKPSEFSSEGVERLERACRQLGEELGATLAIGGAGQPAVDFRCSLAYP